MTGGVVDVEPPVPVMTTVVPAVPADVVPVPVGSSGFVEPVEPAVAPLPSLGVLLATPEQAVTAMSPRMLPRTAT